MRKLFNKFIIFTLTIITVLTFSGCSMFTSSENPPSGNPNTERLPDSVALSSTVDFNTYTDEERSNTVVEAVAKVQRSVVSIVMTRSTGTSYGSGILVDIKTKDKDGKLIETDNEFYILTCHHVINEKGSITVYVPDRNGRNNGDLDYDDSFSFTGTIGDQIYTNNAVALVGGDADTDVAVLKLNISGNMGGVKSEDIVCAKFPMAGYQTVAGETVIAVGNPGGQLPASVSTGVISYIDRHVSITDVGMLTLFQHDSAIDHGSSGGGLFNLYGELIGITNAGSDTLNSIFYAIPYATRTTEVDTGFINVAAQLISSKTATNYGYVSGRWMLGVTIVERTDQFGSTYVAISEVVKGGNAELAGLVAGDIITSVTYLNENKEEVIANVTGNSGFGGIVSDIKKSYGIGDSFTISIKRLEGRQFKYYDKQFTITKELIFCDTGA